jgi:hypothetical protein
VVPDRSAVRFDVPNVQADRIAQELADVGPKASPGIGLLLFFIALIFFPVEVPYAQINLNRVWRAYSAAA